MITEANLQSASIVVSPSSSLDGTIGGKITWRKCRTSTFRNGINKGEKEGEVSYFECEAEKD